MNCKKCGMLIDENNEYCLKCGTKLGQENKEPMTFEEKFKTLYDIEELEKQADEMLERRMRKERIIKGILAIVVAVLIVRIGINLKSKAYRYVDYRVVRETMEYNTSREEISNEESLVEDTTIQEEDSENIAEEESRVNKLKYEVKRICDRFNNGRTPYDGELICVVNDGTTISGTYVIPDPISVDEKDRIEETKRELENLIIGGLSEIFPEELTVNVKINAMYRR